MTIQPDSSALVSVSFHILYAMPLLVCCLVLPLRARGGGSRQHSAAGCWPALLSSSIHTPYILSIPPSVRCCLPLSSQDTAVLWHWQAGRATVEQLWIDCCKWERENWVGCSSFKMFPFYTLILIFPLIFSFRRLCFPKCVDAQDLFLFLWSFQSVFFPKNQLFCRNCFEIELQFHNPHCIWLELGV